MPKMPTAILDFVVEYTPAPELAPGPAPAAGVSRGDDGRWMLTFVLFGRAAKKGAAANDVQEIAIKAEAPLVVDHLPDDLERQRAGRPLWGLRKLAPTCWKLWGPPMAIKENLATYLTLIEVPEPAPWEVSAIVVPT